MTADPCKGSNKGYKPGCFDVNVPKVCQNSDDLEKIETGQRT